MPSLQMYIGILAGLCSLAAYVPFIRDIVGKKPRLKRATWLVWSLSNLLIFMSYYAIGARTTIWVPLAYTLGSAIITIITFKRGNPEWELMDQGLLVIALLSAVRWIFFSNPLLTLATNVFIDIVGGYVYMIRRLLKDEDEQVDIVSTSLFFAGSLLNLFAATSFTLGIAGYPIFLFFMNGIMFGYALRNHRRRQSVPIDVQE